MTMCIVLRLIQSDLTKVTLYFTLTILASAVISPWIYNAGMLLAEVGQSRALNPMLDWLANRCMGTPFASYYYNTVVITALALAGPFIMWCKLSTQREKQPVKPWRVRLRKPTDSSQNGQALHRNVNALLHMGVGILITCSLMAISIVLIQLNGWLSFHQSTEYGNIILKGLASAAIIALISECFFRGVLMGIFLRAMHPALAMIFISLSYAVICSLMPTGSEELANPDKADAGFRMVACMTQKLMSLETFIFSFMLLFCFGLVLSYARYRTASLWLPIGLHIGFVFSMSTLLQVTIPGPRSTQIPKLLTSADGSLGLLPFYLLIISAILIHIILQIMDSKETAEI